MQQRRYNPESQQRSGGCSRGLLIGGGCLAIVVIGIIGAVVVGGFLWDRTTDSGMSWMTDRISDQVGADIGDESDEAEQVTSELPEPESFENRDDYLVFLDSHNRAFAAAMENVGRLLSNPRLREEDWADDMGLQIAIVRQLESRAEDASPPEELAETHEHWVSGMREFRRAMDSTAVALDDFSPGDLTEAVEAINNATRSYVSMAESLREQGVIDENDTLDDLEPVEEP